MTFKSIIEHVTPVEGNIFADLGFEQEEAADLLLQTDAIISENLAIKHSLMEKIATWIKKNELKQDDAAKILGLTPSRISDVIHKKTDQFAIDALVDMLARAGEQD